MADFDVYYLAGPKLIELRDRGRLRRRLPETLRATVLHDRRAQMQAATVRNEEHWTVRPPITREEAALQQVAYASVS